MRGVVTLLVVAGCNQLFGLEPTVLLDAHVIDPNNPDAFRPVLPPDGSTTCSGAPMFETWTYAARSIPFAMQVGAFGLYAAADGAQHMIATSRAGDSIWDVDLIGGTAAQIPGLMPPAGKSIFSVAVSPGGAAIWFKIDNATYVALRETGYQRQLTELGVPDAYEIIPGAPGFFDGTLRMVVRLRDSVGSGHQYVELSSPDGLSWTRGAVLPFGGGNYFAAAMSADGCTLTLARIDAGSMYGLYYAYRAGDGSWGSPLTNLAAAGAAAGDYVINPVLAPSNSSLWFFTSGFGLFEGHP